jgi:hypothetical protein
MMNGLSRIAQAAVKTLQASAVELERRCQQAVWQISVGLEYGETRAVRR